MSILVFEHSTLDSECNSTPTYWTSRYSSFHQNSSVFKVCSSKPKTLYFSHATPLQQSNQPHHVCCKFRDETTFYASHDVTAHNAPQSRTCHLHIPFPLLHQKPKESIKQRKQKPKHQIQSTCTPLPSPSPPPKNEKEQSNKPNKNQSKDNYRFRVQGFGGFSKHEFLLLPSPSPASDIKKNPFMHAAIMSTTGAILHPIPKEIACRKT